MQCTRVCDYSTTSESSIDSEEKKQQPCCFFYQRVDSLAKHNQASKEELWLVKDIADSTRLQIILQTCEGLASKQQSRSDIVGEVKISFTGCHSQIIQVR